MTRARNELQLCVPLKFPLTQQPKSGDAHVYGGRSRFISEKVLKMRRAGRRFRRAVLGAGGRLGDARARRWTWRHA